MLPYALTIFTGAFLLFQVQPLIGKYILPWFGGSPGVWTTCLLFFQALLLGGYAYAHLLTSRLPLRRQYMVHAAMLLIALAFLPITPDESWRPAGNDEPVLRILLLLSASIGVPYFVLSATGPLIQQWFSQGGPGVSPYRLYALSNVGSLLALLSYPFYFEPQYSRQQQAAGWGWGLVVYAVFCLWTGWVTLHKSSTVPAPVVQNEIQEPEQISGLTRLLWVLFPALASVLLLATTNKLCQDVAVVPFLWVLPLALYLVTFILCFDHPRWYIRPVFVALLVLAGGAIGALLLHGTSFKLPVQVLGYAGGLFVACMICHGELYRLKPSSRYLTQYYLCIAAGGALGGWLVAIIAPAFFSRYIELQVGLALLMYVLGVICIVYRARDIATGAIVGVLLGLIGVPIVLATKLVALNGWPGALARSYKVFYEEYWMYAAALLLVCFWFGRGALWGRRKEWALRHAGVPMALALSAGMFFVYQIGQEMAGSVEASRNFYGTLTVVNRKDDEPRLKYFALTHGNITHGMQFADPPLNRLITTYYGEHSGVGRAIRSTPSLGGKRIGVVGLGTGTMAMYGEQGDRLRFYEINPAVELLARTRFNYLQQTKAAVEVVLGDARLTMEDELRRGEIQQFDVLALDAFSSDAIPVHLLTKEAFELYLHHVTWGGIIAVHTSNRYLRLDPAIYRIARELGLHVATISDEPDDSDWWLYRSTWILLSRSEATLAHDDIVDGIGPLPIAPTDVRLWTDDYASLFPLLK
jgi:hypothetical protein